MAHQFNTHTDFGPRRLLDVPEAAEITGLPVRTVRRMFDERHLPLVNVGRRVFVWSDELAAHLDAHTRPARSGVAR